MNMVDSSLQVCVESRRDRAMVWSLSNMGHVPPACLGFFSHSFTFSLPMVQAFPPVIFFSPNRPVCPLLRVVFVTSGRYWG